MKTDLISLVTGSILILILCLAFFPAFMSYLLDFAIKRDEAKWLSNTTLPIELIGRYLFSVYFQLLTFLFCEHSAYEASETLTLMMLVPNLFISKTLFYPIFLGIIWPIFKMTLESLLQRVVDKISSEKKPK
jgi:hypothetical protein